VDTGFTLIEVLIGLVLLTVILGAAYSSFFTVQRAIERFDDVPLQYHEARTTLDLMRREIEGAFLYNPSNLDKAPRTEFVIQDRDVFGKPASRMKFTAFSFTGGGAKTITYFIEEKDKILSLLKTESSPFNDKAKSQKNEGGSEPGFTFEMIEGIESFSIETLFRDKWVKTWDTKETGTLPEIIRISLILNDNESEVRLAEYAVPKTGKQL
jgi:general secretion pathway protein J